jgi:hypothetical protein
VQPDKEIAFDPEQFQKDRTDTQLRGALEILTAEN